MQERFKKHGPTLVLLAIGLVWAFHPMLFSGFRLMQVDMGDTRLNNYILEHTYRWMGSWLRLRPISLWNQPFFYPIQNVGAFTDILLGAAPSYWLMRLLGFAPDTSLQLWMMASLVLNFVVMLAFLRNCMGFNPIASGAGAFLFAFGSPRICQVNHQQLLSQYFSIVAIYGLYRYFRPARLRPREAIFVFYAGFAGQLWAGFYLGWFLFFGLLILGIWALILKEPRRQLFAQLRAHAKPFTLATLFFLIAITPMGFHYLDAARYAGMRAFWNAAMMVPPIQCWIFQGNESWLYFWQAPLGWFRSIAVPHEMRLGVGFATWGLVILGLYDSARRSSWMKAVVFSLLTILILATFYSKDFLLWEGVFYTVPGANAIRAVSRIVLLFLIPLSIGFAALIEKASSRRLIAAALLLVCVFEQGQTSQAYDKFESRNQVEQVARKVDPRCEAFFYAPNMTPEEKSHASEARIHLDAMLASQKLGIPTLNGYSGNFPPDWGGLWEVRMATGTDVWNLEKYLRVWAQNHGPSYERICLIH